jgi:glycosyltransferase involved in cell wall biosynthesis
MHKKDIFIILPLKESLNLNKAGAVSIYVTDSVKYSKYKSRIKIISSDDYKGPKFFKNRSYIENFCKDYKKDNILIIEIHNRPEYVKIINKNFPNSKIVLTFHNDPQKLRGSISPKERQELVNTCSEIVFISKWIKKRFYSGFDSLNHQGKIIYHGIKKKKLINTSKKKNQILFVGKLNENKGYDIFVEAAKIFKQKNSFWKFIAIGNEKRKKIFPNKKIVNEIGYKNNKEVLNYYERSEIAIGNSKWEEPLGRIAIEASSRKCCPIITNVGGLSESKDIAIVLKKNDPNEIVKVLNTITGNKKYLRKLQNKFYNQNHFDIKKISNTIDILRNKILQNSHTLDIKNLKILHITNLNERYYGRLFYNTGRRLNNGFIKLNHRVLTLSDRDLLRSFRSFNDITGSKGLNLTFINTVENFKPDLIILGHADSIKKETLSIIRKKYPKIKIAQWFLDRMDNKWINNRKRFLDKIEFMDHSFCTTHPDALNFGRKYKISFIPNPVDPSLDNLSAYKYKDPQYDLFFAMSHGVHRGVLKKGKFDEREIFIKKLMKKNPNIKFNVYGMNDVQPIWGDDFRNNLKNSKIALNLSQGSPLKFYSSDRLAQLMGNGVATLINKGTRIDKLFSANSAIFYNSINDLSNKLQHLLKNDELRINIAKKGEQEYHKKYNSIIVANYILCKIFNINKKFFW